MENFISGSKVEPFCGTRNVIDIHTRHKLSGSKGVVTFERAPSGYTCSFLPVLTKVTAVAIVNIPGIINVEVSPYKLSVVKAVAFEWDELMPKIALAMSKYLPAVYD